MSLLQAIREEMTALMVDGVLTPSAVVDAARNPNSSMHAQFEWDDSEAAEAYRLQQARALIRRVKVEVVRTDETVVRVPSFTRASPSGYRETQVIVGTHTHAETVIITLNQIATMLRNLSTPEVDDLLEDVEILRKRLVAELDMMKAV